MSATIIQKTPGVLGGAACVGKRRIAVWMLAIQSRLGLKDAAIRAMYQPPLTVEELAAAWSYWRENRQEIEDAIKANDEAE